MLCRFCSRWKIEFSSFVPRQKKVITPKKDDSFGDLELRLLCENGISEILKFRVLSRLS